MADITLRRMTLADAPAVHAIEAATFAIPWSLQSFEEEMTRNACARYLVAQTPAGDIIGFAGVWVVIDEGHITNIAVREDYRGQGIGRQLTAGLMQYAANLGVTYMTLKVRRSNETAQNLYRSLGFIQVGVRKKYMLYDNKAGTEMSAEESLNQLRIQVGDIGYEMVSDRGDYRKKTPTL